MAKKSNKLLLIGGLLVAATGLIYFTNKNSGSGTYSTGKLPAAKLQDWKNFLINNANKFNVPQDLGKVDRPDTGSSSFTAWYELLKQKYASQTGGSSDYGLQLANEIWPKWMVYAGSLNLDPYSLT